MISVVVSCYNKAPYIEEAIQSAQRQTVTDLEIIVVDDGSTDDSLDIIRGLAEKDDRVRVLETGESGSGASTTRNKGLQFASREWLLFLDGDDWLFPRHIERLMLKVVNSDVDIAYSRYCYTTTDGSRQTFPYGTVKEGRLFALATMGCPFAIHAAIVRKELALVAGGFSPGYEPCEDWDFWLKILRMGARCALVCDTVAPYRMVPTSAQRNVGALVRSGWRILEEGAREDSRIGGPHPDFAYGCGTTFVELNKAFMWGYAACFALVGDTLAELPSLSKPSIEDIDEMGMAQLFYDTMPFALCELPDAWPRIWAEWKTRLCALFDCMGVPGTQRYIEALIKHPWQNFRAQSQQDWLEREFENEDPWHYKTSEYEKVKYEQTLRLIPEWSVRALEIGCAEGVFTSMLAEHVRCLDAVDISSVALRRAVEALCDWDNIRFHLLDAFEDPLPRKYDLIVCSEMLYHTDQAHSLLAMAEKLFHHLNKDGCLVMAHAKVVTDSHNRPAFDWHISFGVETITKAFLTKFHLVAEIETPLYYVQRYQKRLRAFAPSRMHENYGAIGPGELSDSIVYEQSEYLPILLYHGVGEKGDYNTWWRTSIERFEEQMEWLAGNDYSVIDVGSFLSWLEGKCSLPAKPILITFDDGEATFYENAWPVLKKYEFSAIMNLPVGYVGKTAGWGYGPSVPILTEAQVLELAGEGVAFGSHSMYHIDFSDYGLDYVLMEAKLSRALLEDLLGEQVTIFAYPYGATNAEIKALVRSCGYEVAFEAEDILYRPTSRHDDRMAIQRIPVFGRDALDSFARKVEWPSSRSCF